MHQLNFVLFSVGVFKNGRVEIIANDQGNRITPSYVAFTAEGERLVGDSAKNQLTSNPENTVFDAKRLIGREWSDKSVQNDIKFYPFKVFSCLVIPEKSLLTIIFSRLLRRAPNLTSRFRLEVRERRPLLLRKSLPWFSAR